MRDVDLAWIAGFFDGEGCIRARASKKGARLKVTLTQQDRAPLDWIKSEFGGGVYATGNAKTCYRWEVDCGRASAFLRAIRPYLRVKAARADLALSVSATELLTMPNRLKVAQ